MKLKAFIYIVICMLVGCTPQEQIKLEVVAEPNPRHSSEGLRRYVYEREGTMVREKILIVDDKIVFMERTDLNDSFIVDHRAIKVRAKANTISVGESFVASVFMYGPKPCDNLLYYVSEPIHEKDTLEGVVVEEFSEDAKQLIRRYTTNEDTAYFSLDIDVPGKYYYVGVIVVSCDTVSYPRQYQFQGEFEVI